MSARGRGPDSTLVHMSPREVEGLQKLAVAHGTSLTINPDTGLPEAFSLKDLLPTLAGAALNYFAPGVGTAVGGVLGLSGAAGTGLAVGAATAAISGDLGKGLQAGLGAYGGAGITDTLVGMGAGQLGAQAMEEGVGQKLSDQALQDSVANRMASATMSDKLGAGLSFAGSNPMTALKTGAKYLAAAASPAIFAGDVGNTVPTVTPRRPSTPISNEKFDPRSQTFERNQPRSNDGYDPISQLYSRSAAKGGLMSLAHGGAVHYEGGGPVGAAAAPFDEDAWLRNYIATNYPQPAAPVVTNTNAGSGFAATPAAPVAETAPLAAAQVSPQAGAGIAALSNAQAAPATPVAETAPAPVAQVLPQAPQYSPPDFFDTGKDIQDVRRTFAEQLAKDNTNNAALVAAQGLYGSVLDRKAESPEVLQNWATKFGATIDDSERDIFRAAAVPETSTRANQQNYIPISGLNALYQSELGRPGTADPEGMAFWQKTFGDYIDPTELAGFKEHAARERAARPVVVNPVVQNPAVVTDLTTAGTQYIAPGVGGSTGAGQVGGGTTINPNGTITTSPRIPGIPVGGFTGMTGVRDTYEAGGGNLGYTPKFVPTTTAEFDAKYSNTGYSKKMYDYLRGKGPKPTKMTDVDETGKETYREIMRPYKEAVLGLPVNTNTKLNWNKETGKYDRNLDYMRQKTITDPTTKEKSTINYMSINQAKAALAKTPLEGNALANWSITNFVDPDTLAEATGMTKNQITTLLANAKADKAFGKAEGGLMALANGGLAGVGYASGGLPDKEFTDNTTGIKYYFDFPNGIYRSETTVKDGVTYRWNPLTNKYETGSASGSGIAGLMDMSGGSNAGDARGPGTESGPGGGYGIPGATMVGGISGPTTGLASGANSLAATLGNMSGGKGLLGAISDTLARNIDPNFSHEGRLGRGSSADQAAIAEAAQAARAAIADDREARDLNNALNTPNSAEIKARDSYEARFGASDRADAAATAAQNGQPGGGDIAEGDRGDIGSGSGYMASGGMAGYAQGGLGSLGGYSDGGRLLRGPGDGVSDSIPASIGDRQPARLADGEFVVPARIVSELGNGSTEAGARALYKMMDRIQANRRKTTGKNSVAVDSKAHKYLPA